MLTPFQKSVADAIQSRGVNLPCPRCGSKEFSIEDGFTFLTMQKDLSNIVLGGSGIPAAVVTCQRCSHITLHALGTLGLLPK